MNQLRPVALLALALGLALSGCKPAPQAAITDAAAPAPSSTAAATTPATPVAAAPADASASCPHPVFDDFLKHFGNEIALQETSTADPLLDSQGREMQVTRLPDGQVQVQMRTPDTSDQQIYTFAQKPCWQLVKREDESI